MSEVDRTTPLSYDELFQEIEDNMPEELKNYFTFNEFIFQDNANKLFTKKIGDKLNPILFLKEGKKKFWKMISRGN